MGALNGRTPVLKTHSLNPFSTVPDLADLATALVHGKAGSQNEQAAHEQAAKGDQRYLRCEAPRLAAKRWRLRLRSAATSTLDNRTGGIPRSLCRASPRQVASTHT